MVIFSYEYQYDDRRWFLGDLRLIDNDKDYFKNKTEKVEALRACADLWDHELVGDSKDLQEATRRLIIQKN